MPAAEYLVGLNRLVTLFSAPAPMDDERLQVVQGLVALAQEESLVVHVAREGQPDPEGAGRGVDAEPVLAVLRQHGVRRLVIRRGAVAREIAQFAGLLGRVSPPSPAPGAPATAAQMAPVAPLLRGLDELCIWSIQLDLHEPAGGVLVGLTPALRTAVDAVAGADSPATIADAYAVVGTAFEAASESAATRSDAAAQIARALAHLVELRDAHVDRRGADQITAHRTGVDALLATRLEIVIDAVAEGTVPEAWRVVRAAADRAVPLLLNRLGEADTIDERRRCFNAVLDAGGAVDALLDALRDTRWFVVRNVALVLGELREPAAVRPLARVLYGGDRRVREAAAQALTRIDGPAATHALMGGLRDESVVVRRLTARALQRAPGHRVAVSPALIVSRLRIESDVVVAQELIEALRGLGTAEAYGALASLAAESDARPVGPLDGSVAAAALRALGRVPMGQLTEMLRDLAQADDVRLRGAALHVAPRLLATAG